MSETSQLIDTKQRSCLSTILYMFDQSNPKNVLWCCGTTFMIPLIILLVGAGWLAIVGLGYVGIRVTYSSAYNMTNGDPLVVGDKTKLLCNNQLGGNLFGWCTYYGLFSLLIAVFFVFLCFTIGMLIFQLHELVKKSYKGYAFAKSSNDRSGLITSVLMVLMAPVLYIITVYLGVASSYVLYGETYNITTGWPLNGDHSKGILMCRNTPDNSLFMGCVFSGMVTNVILIVGTLLGSCLICLIGMVLCSPFYYCFLSCWDSYKFSKNVVVATHDVTIVINEGNCDENEDSKVSGE